MSMTRTCWFWWWAWKVEKVEKWLEKMESQGWNLYSVDCGSFRFKFIKGEARKIRYCADFQNNKDEQYIKLLTDDKWELVWNGAHGWYIWKKEYVNENPEIYTDNQSLIDRNKRVIKTLAILTAPLIAIFAGLININLRQNDFGYRILAGLYVVEFIFFGYGLFQLVRFNMKLKDNTNTK